MKAGRLKDFAEEKSSAPEERSEVPAELPHSIFQGKLRIGDIVLDCHVLNDERRVFTQGEMVRDLTGGTDSSNLARYLRRNPLITDDLSGGPIRFYHHHETLQQHG
jgi:hypothetical protein